MNVLLKLRKEMALCDAIPFKYILYSAMLSNVVSYTEEETRWGIFFDTSKELYDHYEDWCHSDLKKNEVYTALQELSSEGYITFDEEGRIYLGEFRGRRFFTFEIKSSMSDGAIKLLNEAIESFSNTKSAVAKSRGRFIREQVDQLLEKGIDKLGPGDFTNLHGFLYEIYTGGEVYNIRNKVEYFQTTNILKAYDKCTTFAIVVNAVLNYDKYRKKGVPTLTNVGYMKDDVFKSLTRTDTSSKEYMRNVSSAVSEDGGFS